MLVPMIVSSWTPAGQRGCCFELLEAIVEVPGTVERFGHETGRFCNCSVGRSSRHAVKGNQLFYYCGRDLSKPRYTTSRAAGKSWHWFRGFARYLLGWLCKILALCWTQSNFRFNFSHFSNFRNFSVYKNQNNQVEIRCSGAYGQPIKQLSKNELIEEIVDA